MVEYTPGSTTQLQQHPATDAAGTFGYNDGETVAFTLGTVVIGSALGAAQIVRLFVHLFGADAVADAIHAAHARIQ